MKTGLIEVRPIFVRKEGRTRGHVFGCMLALNISRKPERRLHAAFGTTDTQPHTTVTRLPKPDARQKGRLALSVRQSTLPHLLHGGEEVGVRLRFRHLVEEQLQRLDR